MAVNLEKGRVIIHLEKSSMTVCGSPGCTKISQAPAGGRKEELKALQCFAIAWQVSAPGSERESVLHQTRSENVSHMFYCQYCITPSIQNIGGGRKLQYQEKRLQMKASVYVGRRQILTILYLNCFLKTFLYWMHKKEGPQSSIY